NIDILPSLAAADIPELKARPEIKVSSSPTMMLNTILLQTRDPLLANVKMRQAIAAAIDTRELVKAVSEGLGQPNASVVPTESRFYSKEQARLHSYDPAKAARLLKEAGYAGQPIVLM
ncbi:ABC transporter substrate-binding protein, partial [Cupriavidus sp. 2MCAB6]